MKLKWDIVKCVIGMGHCKNLQYWNEAQYKTICGIGMGHSKECGIGLDSLALAQAGRGM